MGKRIRVALVALAAMAMTSAFAPGSQSRGPVSGAEPVENITDQYGQRIWRGEIASDLEPVLEAVDQFIGEDPNSFAGSALSSDRSLVEVYYTSEGAEELGGLRTLITPGTFDRLVVPIEVEFNLAELIAEQTALARDVLDGTRVVDIGPSFTQNALTVGVEADYLSSLVGTSSGGADGMLHVDRQTLSELSPRLAESAIPVFLTPSGGAPTPDGTRRNDSAAYYGGAQILGSGNSCSLGVPINLSGVRRMLTAGHCGSGSFYNGSSSTRYVGSTYTTSYPGNADIYGDWQLLSGSTYSLNLYSGSLSSTAYLPITGALWGARTEGSYVCSSGRTTGSICRYEVRLNYRSIVNTDGELVGDLVVLYHDEDLNGVRDCNGWAGGDSGGPLYYASGSGVAVSGIVSASFTAVCSLTTYYGSMLYGVRQWNSNVVLG